MSGRSCGVSSAAVAVWRTRRGLGPQGRVGRQLDAPRETVRVGNAWDAGRRRAPSALGGASLILVGAGAAPGSGGFLLKGAALGRVVVELEAHAGENNAHAQQTRVHSNAHARSIVYHLFQQPLLDGRERLAKPGPAGLAVLLRAAAEADRAGQRQVEELVERQEVQPGEGEAVADQAGLVLAPELGASGAEKRRQNAVEVRSAQVAAASGQVWHDRGGEELVQERLALDAAASLGVRQQRLGLPLGAKPQVQPLTSVHLVGVQVQGHRHGDRQVLGSRLPLWFVVDGAGGEALDHGPPVALWFQQQPLRADVEAGHVEHVLFQTEAVVRGVVLVDRPAEQLPRHGVAGLPAAAGGHEVAAENEWVEKRHVPEDAGGPDVEGVNRRLVAEGLGQTGLGALDDGVQLLDGHVEQQLEGGSASLHGAVVAIGQEADEPGGAAADACQVFAGGHRAGFGGYGEVPDESLSEHCGVKAVATVFRVLVVFLGRGLRVNQAPTQVGGEGASGLGGVPDDEAHGAAEALRDRRGRSSQEF
ncbi:TonB-dependent hemoglobin/transferrin/lactoferrin family receptor [Babesia caballi]|uniref:TonB-dependent hemoglobin/transferrin/lactoferrin family receptor n=1 Tax=Babesia caballi TaxID=5871 RepID=A0AAV4LL52_BABCB|nr:TonB-dependent hemoglobin/transferrin/lactoferrin family receptor [Babesia caballi]